MKRLKHTPVYLGDKQRMRRFIASPLTLAALSLLVVWVGWQTWDMYGKWRLSRAAVERANDSYQLLQEREAFLAQKIDTLSSESGIEAEVRERFSVAKEGEKVIVILDKEEQGALLEEDTGWWATFKGWFRRD